MNQNKNRRKRFLPVYLFMKTLKLTFAALLTGGAIFFFIYFFQVSLWGMPSDVSISVPPATTTVYAGEFKKPSLLTIPVISLVARVQHVGLTAKKAMGIPTNFTDVAWYKLGPTPGEVGSAVIAGHVDNALGLKGVFKQLSTLTLGDEIYVTDADGTNLRFVVREVNSYAYDKAPAEEIFHEKERRLLRLITCGGTWIRSLKTYDTRVVVTAEYTPLD